MITPTLSAAVAILERELAESRAEAERLRAAMPTAEVRREISAYCGGNVQPCAVVMDWLSRLDAKPAIEAADRLLDLDVPDEEVNAELRAMGIDPQRLAAKGAAIAGAAAMREAAARVAEYEDCGSVAHRIRSLPLPAPDAQAERDRAFGARIRAVMGTHDAVAAIIQAAEHYIRAEKGGL